MSDELWNLQRWSNIVNIFCKYLQILKRWNIYEPCKIVELLKILLSNPFPSYSLQLQDRQDTDIVFDSGYVHKSLVRLRTEDIGVYTLSDWVVTVICERVVSRHQRRSHRSVVWAKSPVFPRVDLPNRVHGYTGGRHEWWPTARAENQVETWRERFNMEIHFPML